MRWYEILNEVVFKHDGEFAVFVTRQFANDYKDTIKSQPKVKASLENFLVKKLQEPLKPVNTSDNKMAAGTPLENYWHFHLVHGKVMIIYTVDRSHIEIYAIVTHKQYDTASRANALKNYIQSLDQNDLVEFQYKHQKEFTDNQLQEVSEFIYSLIPDDVNELKQYLLSKSGLFLEYLYDMVDIQIDNDIDAFNTAWKEKFKMYFDDYIKQAVGNL